ncbi:adenylate kinase [Candidatus Ishikawella capsulata]|uniref:Adenylate kinase n=1 Tax=Candidatus Ishikawaella capsulata Mpkobe TaxID=476281 RepID=C5WCY3_9ENTR|nr:adenylate kinase [Candidatus Ishikawaella capsulata]BAH83189.1 adenylate kinase [Candidatus Ishikawaella capsulata Mpkobe]
MYIILLGAPGAGKGTQAHFIKNKYDLLLVSTGDILRDAVQKDSHLNNKVQSLMNRGEFITDELMIALVKKYINNKKGKNGVLLDGFPRTMPQAIALREAGFNIDCVIELEVPDNLIIKRIVGRRIHALSGRTYHVTLNPPKVHNRDDVTGEILTIRKDDQEYIVRKRLIEYHKMTEPVINYYKRELSGHTNYYKIDGTLPIIRVNQEITKILESIQ